MTMISADNLRYYIDPVQTRQAIKLKADGTPLPLRVLALRYRRPGFKPDNIGTVVDAQYQRVDGNELWWVDGDGDYFYGVQEVDRVSGRRVIGLLNDDVFVCGINNSEHPSGRGTIISNYRRSDSKSVTDNLSVISKRVFPAATWALDLMPVRDDTQEIVDAKLALAKQKHTQRSKKAEIYREGMRREWLAHLEGLRANHDMPAPRFKVGYSGIFLQSTPDRVDMADLPEPVRSRMTPLTNTAIRPDGVTTNTELPVQQFFGAPFTVLTGATVADGEELRSVSIQGQRYAIYDALHTSSGQIIESYRFGVLSEF